METTNTANRRYQTIAAIATAVMAGIGIIRLSGPDTLAIAGRLFQNHSLQDHQHARLHLARIINGRQHSDEVLVAVSRAPRFLYGRRPLNQRPRFFIYSHRILHHFEAGAEPVSRQVHQRDSQWQRWTFRRRKRWLTSSTPPIRCSTILLSIKWRRHSHLMPVRFAANW